jgi:hypothetical protein
MASIACILNGLEKRLPLALTALCNYGKLPPISRKVSMTGPKRETEIPDLKFVASGDLVLHEQHDVSRSAPLAERIKRDGLLKNPPVVAPINGEGRFVVLDGANRTTGLTEMGIPHIVVQVVDYEDPELVLDTWYHLIAEFGREELGAELQKIPGITFEGTELLRARAALARRSAMAYLVWPAGDVFIACGEDDLHVRARQLNALVDVYRFRSRIYRVNTDQLDRLKPYYENLTALIVFPHYERSEIIELARTGARLPAGITRHVIPRRALRLNIPLSVMAENRTLAEKNEWLQAWLRKKLANKEVRYYQESTWLFDE